MNKASIIFKLLRFSGLPWLFRHLVQNDKVTILMFHNPDPGNTEKAFRYLQRHYSVIPLQQYLEARRAATPLPKRALIITFDDGHAGNYALLPIIRQLNIPVTIFLCSDIVDTRRHFWFKHTDELTTDDRERIKKIPNEERLEAMKAYGFEQTKEYDDRQALTHEEIEEMKSWVDFQSHTCLHPVLTMCDDETARREIALSKQHLERDYALTINAISYPNGDYSERDVRLCEEAGYICGITVDYGFNDNNTNLMRLKRISVNDARSHDELIVKSSGCYAFLRQQMKRKKAHL